MVTKNTILDKRGGGFMQLVASQGVTYSAGGYGSKGYIEGGL